MISTAVHGFSTKDILRHGTSIVLLIAAWKILQRWYFFQHPSDYLLFACLAITGFLLAAGPFLLSELQRLPRKRLLFCFPLLILLLPWGEWLSLGTIFTRESWSEQLFKHGIFLYACISVLRIFPSFASWLQYRFLNLLEWISIRRILLWCAPLALFLFTAWIALFVYKETPVVQDSAAHLFQTQVFKNFKLFAPAPVAEESFTGPLDLLIMKDGKWYSMYFPGFAALMAPAALLHLEWLVSPLLAAMTCLVWILYAERWHQRRTAIVLALILILSPFVVVMSSTVMVFTPELFFASLVIYLLRLSLEKPTALILLSIFLSVAAVVLVRSFSLMPFLLPIFVYVTFQSIRKQLLRVPVFIFLGVAAGSLLLFFFQYKTTGNPLQPGYTLEFPDLGWGFGEHFIGTHSPLKALDNVSNNLLGLDHWVGGWYSGTLIFVIAYLLRNQIQAWDKVLIMGCCFLMAFYFFFFFQDLFFGPRYYYVFTPILLLFISRVVTEQSITPGSKSVILIPLLVLTILISVPLTLPAFIKRYDPSKTQSGKLKEEIRKTNGQRMLVFLDKSAGQNFVNWNDPFLKSNLILARDLKEHNAEVEKLFPNHKPVWFRMTSSFEKAKISGGFRFVSEPDHSPLGSVNLFDLAMALQAPRNYPKQDFFDICYIDVFDFGAANQNYRFLEHAETEPLYGGEYKRNFRKGIVHAGKMMLLPIMAFEKNGDDWENKMDTSKFKAELVIAQDAFGSAGEIGKPILNQIDKVKRRIDRNSDQQLTDPEIFVFLNEKIKLIRQGASL